MYEEGVVVQMRDQIQIGVRLAYCIFGFEVLLRLNSRDVGFSFRLFNLQCQFSLSKMFTFPCFFGKFNICLLLLSWLGNILCLDNWNFRQQVFLLITLGILVMNLSDDDAMSFDRSSIVMQSN